MKRTSSILITLALLGLAGCRSTSRGEAEPAAAEQPAAKADSAAATPAATEPAATAELGKPAPDFTLNDLDGKPVTLSSFRGKFVVLEWFNPKCPFVRAAHGKGSLAQGPARQLEKGVVWLAVNSGAPGKQGHGAEANREGMAEFKMSYPILSDESGRVGKLYGAERTPHMYVIDKQGVLVYRGAIDNSPDGEGDSPEGGELVNYVDAALGALGAGKPVPTPETKAYGCTVKYAG